MIQQDRLKQNEKMVYDLNKVLLSLPFSFQGPCCAPCSSGTTYLDSECRFIRVNYCHNTANNPSSSRRFTVSSVIPSK